MDGLCQSLAEDGVDHIGKGSGLFLKVLIADSLVIVNDNLTLPYQRRVEHEDRDEKFIIQVVLPEDPVATEDALLEAGVDPVQIEYFILERILLHCFFEVVKYVERIGAAQFDWYVVEDLVK